MNANVNNMNNMNMHILSIINTNNILNTGMHVPTNTNNDKNMHGNTVVSVRGLMQRRGSCTDRLGWLTFGIPAVSRSRAPSSRQARVEWKRSRSYEYLIEYIITSASTTRNTNTNIIAVMNIYMCNIMKTNTNLHLNINANLNVHTCMNVNVYMHNTWYYIDFNMAIYV